MIKQAMFAATALIAAAAAPAVAQTQNGLVTVNVTDVSVLNNFLNDTQIAALNNLNVPITVQVPVGVAANVCNVSAAVLGRTGPTGGSCEAKSGSQALAQSVNRQLLSQKK